VLLAVDFNAERCLGAIEVEDIYSYPFLALKSKTEAVFAEDLPKDFFGDGHLVS
jgi:hypothetical protein